MLKFDYADATPERKQEMIGEILSKYNMEKRDEMIQALGHAQGLLDCSQKEFASHPLVGVTERSVRSYKKEYLDIYVASFEKHKQTPELKEVSTEFEEDVMEAVYGNLLARLQDSRTSTSDLAKILEYFDISGAELRKYVELRNSTMRGFIVDNTKSLIAEEEMQVLVKSVIAESSFLYQGNQKSAGNTLNAINMNTDDPLVKLELMTFGLLFVGLYNGYVGEQFKEFGETLRLLKLVAGKDVNEKSHKQFERIDDREPELKSISPEMEKELIDIYGQKQGREMFNKFNSIKDKVIKKTAIKMPKYEDVAEDYSIKLRVFPEIKEMPLKILLAKLDAEDSRTYENRYKDFLTEIQD